MLKFIGKRLLMMIPVLIGISFIIFAIMSLTPGDPARLILGEYVEDEAIQAMRDELGLNDPFFQRYFDYMAGLIHGDFGVSWVSDLPVLEEIGSRIPTTLT